MKALRRIANRLGYELTPLRKSRDPYRQLVAAMKRVPIDAVLDVGANTGQYRRLVREAGWDGPVLSFEPLPALHAQLEKAARHDPLWEIAPAMALGAGDGKAILEVSAESDMSSLLPQTAAFRAISPSSAIVERIEVGTSRLDGLAWLAARPWQQIFLKIDVQGAEPAVLEGARGLLGRVAGLQLELSLFPVYEGESHGLDVLAGLRAEGFLPHILIPGYFEPKLARQLQMDVVLMRARDGDPH